MIIGGYTDNISIHALREEGDAATSAMPRMCVYFYPRPPRGGRRSMSRRSTTRSYFYPRPPRGGRLAGLVLIGFVHAISIHALREEGDAALRSDA